MRFMIILDPAISTQESDPSIDNSVPYPPYDKGVEYDIFIKRPNGELDLGKVWPYLPGYRLEDFECQDAYGGECWDENVDR